MAPIIRTEKLRKVYAVGKERVVALNNVDLSIEKGEFCCIVGQSGSGKSTLLNQLAGLEKPTSGKVYIGKHEISKMTENELAEFRQQHLGFIFQSYNLLPTMTAAENVALPLMFKGVDKKTRLARARKELKSMGLLGRANHLPTEMSGGQQQRVGIARAFVSSPKVIFADEPTGNLDSRTSKQVLYRMLEMSKNSGVTFVMVTHEPDLAECADRIVTILDGKVCSNVVQDEETKKPGALAVLSFAWDNGTIGIVLRAAGKLYRHSRPRKLRLSGLAGLGDPMQTGVLAGLLYAALPGASDITWDYTGRCFDVTAEAEGRVVPLYILYILGGVLASGPVRRTRAYLKGRSPQISPETA